MKEKITCSKLAQLYSNETGNKIGKTKMFYILKNKSNLRFLKTCIKTSKIIRPDSIFSCLYFIKIIARSILLGFNIYFMDESSILSKNNHYKCWRYANQNIYHNISKPQRSNLLLIVRESKVIYFEINKKGTNQEIFLEFLKRFLDTTKNKENKEFILVMDNLTSHKTPAITNFLLENKIDVIYNTPYVSEFNCVELAFRHLKKIIYSKIYESIEMAEKEIINLLTNGEINKTLSKNFCETLQTYMEYSNKYKYKNLNNLNYNY